MIDENYLALLSGANKNLAPDDRQRNTRTMPDFRKYMIIYNIIKYEKISFNCSSVLWP